MFSPQKQFEAGSHDGITIVIIMGRGEGEHIECPRAQLPGVFRTRHMHDGPDAYFSSVYSTSHPYPSTSSKNSFSLFSIAAFSSMYPYGLSPLLWGLTAILLFTMTIWSDADAKVMLSEGEGNTKYRELQQKLVEVRVLEDDMQTTLDRAKTDRDEASWEMSKAAAAVIAKMYREAGLLACKFATTTTKKGSPIWAYGTLCEEGNRLLETQKAFLECRNGQASGCERLKGKLNEYGAIGFKETIGGRESDLAELAKDLDALKSEVDRNDTKAYVTRTCKISANLSKWVNSDGLGKEKLDALYKKMKLACDTGKTIASLYEDGRTLIGLFDEAKELDRVVQSNLSQMQIKFDAVRASRQTLDSHLSALVTAEKEEETEGGKNCDTGPVLNPELARADEQIGKNCKPKSAKKDKVCDETLGCPEDESDTTSKDKDLLAKLDADLERIRSGQPGTAGGALPGESLDAGEDGFSFDKLAMLKSLRSGLGAYRDSKQALKDMKDKAKGSSASEGDIDFSLPPGPCPETLTFLASRLRNKDARMTQALNFSIRDMTTKAGGSANAISGSRAQANDFRRQLREVAPNPDLSRDHKTQLINTYKDGIMVNEVTAKVVACQNMQAPQKAGQPGQANGSLEGFAPTCKYCLDPSFDK